MTTMATVVAEVGLWINFSLPDNILIAELSFSYMLLSG